MLLAGTQMIGTPWEEKASVLKGQKQVHITAAQRKMWWGGAAREKRDYRAATFISKWNMTASTCFFPPIVLLNTKEKSTKYTRIPQKESKRAVYIHCNVHCLLVLHVIFLSLSQRFLSNAPDTLGSDSDLSSSLQQICRSQTAISVFRHIRFLN